MKKNTIRTTLTTVVTKMFTANIKVAMLDVRMKVIEPNITYSV